MYCLFPISLSLILNLHIQSVGKSFNKMLDHCPLFPFCVSCVDDQLTVGWWKSFGPEALCWEGLWRESSSSPISSTAGILSLMVSVILYQPSHKGSPRILEWVAYLFSSGSSWSRNQTRASCIAGRVFASWATRDALSKRRCCQLHRVLRSRKGWQRRQRLSSVLEINKVGQEMRGKKPENSMSIDTIMWWPRRLVWVGKAAVGFTEMRSVPSGAVRWKWQGK